MRDEIFISSLRLDVRIGVPEAERATPQQLEVDIIMEPLVWFTAMNDQIERTVDYQAVADRVHAWVANREFRLLETLGEAIAELVLREFEVLRVRLEIRKFILPRTQSVGVRLERSR